MIPGAPGIAEALEATWRINELADAFLSMARQREVQVDVALMLQEAIGIAMSKTSKLVAIHEVFPTEPIYAIGNPILLREALNNLVTNAIEAVPSDGEVTVEAIQEDGHIRVRIDDNGPGIPEAQMAHLFEPFSSSKKSGLGLGLLSAKHIVEMYEGRLRVESPTNGGTRVEVKLSAGASVEPSLSEHLHQLG